MPESTATTATANSGEPHTTPEQESPRSKIDKSGLYDLFQIKRLLDDEVIAFMEESGFQESKAPGNIKIICGTIAVITALYCHFGKLEFPKARGIVLACVGLYAICNAVISGTVFFLEGNAFYVGHLSARVRQISKNRNPNIWVKSTLGDKGTSIYELQYRTTARGKEGATLSEGYEKYFTTEGRVLLQELRKDLKSTLRDFDSKKSK